jgi:HEAT repeat protein
MEMLLNHEDAVIRETAVHQLGFTLPGWMSRNEERRYSMTFSVSIVRCLEDVDVNVQARAAMAIASLEMDKFKPQLRRLWKTGRRYSKQAAAMALLSLGESSMAPHVAALLDTAKQYLRWQAAMAIQDFLGEFWDNDTMEQDVEDAKEWWAKYQKEQ